MIPLTPAFAGAPAGRGTGRPPRKRPCESSGGRWWLAPLAVTLVVAVFVATYYPVARVQYRETREEARLAAELAVLQSRNARLRKQVAWLRTPEGVEDYARTELGLVKRGEQVGVVRGIEGSEIASAGPGAPVIDSDRVPEEPPGQWTAFLDFVFNVQ